MPVSYVTEEQRESYGRYNGPPSSDDLARYFHLDDADRVYIARRRGHANRLGIALQLTTLRYLGAFLDDPLDLPSLVLSTVAKQLGITDTDPSLHGYRTGELRWDHQSDIRRHCGFVEITEPSVGFRLGRWLYALCWTGTERPSVLFERATAWLLTHKVLLPGRSTLERFVARVKSRVEEHLWRRLGTSLSDEQRERLERLLTVPAGSRNSHLDQLRSGPVRVSGPSLIQALTRLQVVRELGIELPTVAHLPASRVTALARFAGAAKASAVSRLPDIRRLATLVAFVHCLEATAHDDAVEVLEMLLRDVFATARKEDRKTRLRTLKDLDRAATLLADACQVVLDTTLPDKTLRKTLFAKVPRDILARALQEVSNLVRPPDDVFYSELSERYRRIRRFLPFVLENLRFGASPAGEAVVAAYEWLRTHPGRFKVDDDVPREVIRKRWQRYAVREDGSIDHRAYTFCVLDELYTSLRRRDVFVAPSWKYADPRAGLLNGNEWETARPIICRTLGLSPTPSPTLLAITKELDDTYRAVASRLPDNPAVRFEGTNELVVSSLDKLEEPASLLALRTAVNARLPRVDIEEILLEIAARTGFTDAFTHLTERSARAADLPISICAVLLAEASNTGFEPLIRSDMAALKRSRLSWVDQNYFRNDTITPANAILVAAQNRLVLAQQWGGGEVASADGMRFVVPVRTVHAAANPKYFGRERGVTWYNLISDQFSGLNDITVPGTLRDSLILLGVVLEQPTELQPTQIMTDTGAYSDVVFGLFRLLGYRFCPRLADVGGTRFWRIDAQADYGDLNAVARQRVNMPLIEQQWDDILRLVGSLKLGCVSANGIMRTLQIGDRPTRLAQALAEFGRIEKTLHTLTYIDDEAKRRGTLTQLNRGEGRHSVARAIFHGKRGELRQRYQEGQEDQLGALGLVLNMVVLWNTIYMEAALDQLRQEGFPVRDEDVARLSPLTHDHINMLGRYSFAVPEAVARGELRPLRNPDDGEDD
ncbi:MULTISPECIES: Tn3 family transposase [Rhodanobacter]|uniref:Tn3 family transposase n=1 Tax=Rhodanobacter humi TaxID=1888173 RepID=A0ABV4AVT9_9GAMM|nr:MULTISPECIES: Tn3 family transposase [Rhodanobacter]KZC17191.1 transposase [Rhodanobacter sp. FW104-R8]KZC21553.1 transposase [Rhodanobacter denitrificans]KZC28714.1 transposase [Rhodanobacter sp. FW510-T8]KZC30623.1 transposase [Rhodanobacter sp. FW510-R10]UJJ53126.1 Tn3 family transposase [Rhodanobacter denitrificans]